MHTLKWIKPASHTLALFAGRCTHALTHADSRLFFLAGLITQAIWLVAVPWSWGWDSTGYLAIGRMYFHLPYEMWSLKYYYPPGYPIVLSLLGVHHLDTILVLKMATLAIGASMPWLLYRIIQPFNPLAASLTAAIFTLSFTNAVFSTDIMNNHIHLFCTLLMTFCVTRYLAVPSLKNAMLLALATCLAASMRQVSGYVFAAALLTLAVAGITERRGVSSTARHLLTAVLALVLVTGAVSVLREAALGGNWQYGLTRDYGSRVMFQGAYYGASIYFKEFHPDQSALLVKPENGPASRRLFDGLKVHLERTRTIEPELQAQGVTTRGARLRALINNPTLRNTYYLWWKLDSVVGIDAADRLFRDVVFETVAAQPRIIEYYLWNFWNFLFGPNILQKQDCDVCHCPPCFDVNKPQVAISEHFMRFQDTAGPGVNAEMHDEFARQASMLPFGQVVSAITRTVFDLKPLLTALLFASVFLATGRTRCLTVLCAASVLILAATTSVAWPAQTRYWLPAFPFLLTGAVIAILEIAGRAGPRTPPQLPPDPSSPG